MPKRCCTAGFLTWVQVFYGSTVQCVGCLTYITHARTILFTLYHQVDCPCKYYNIPELAIVYSVALYNSYVMPCIGCC